MPISYAKRTQCQVCRVPSMRKPRRRCDKCGLSACADCRRGPDKKCCEKSKIMHAKIEEQRAAAEAKKLETDG